MEIIYILLIGYFLPLILCMIIGLIMHNHAGDCDFLFGISFLPGINILFLFVVIGVCIHLFGEWFGAFILKLLKNI